MVVSRSLRTFAGLGTAIGIIVSSASAADGAAAAVSAASSEAKPQIIPAETFAEPNLFYGPKMSPDGRHVAVQIRRDGVNAVSVLDSRTGKSVAVARMSEDVEYNWHRWAGSDIVLISAAQMRPVLGEDTRLTRLVALKVSTGERWFIGPKYMGPEGDDLLHVADDGSSILLSFQKTIYDWPSVTRISLPRSEGQRNHGAETGRRYLGMVCGR